MNKVLLVGENPTGPTGNGLFLRSILPQIDVTAVDVSVFPLFQCIPRNHPAGAARLADRRGGLGDLPDLEGLHHQGRRGPEADRVGCPAGRCSEVLDIVPTLPRGNASPDAPASSIGDDARAISGAFPHAGGNGTQERP